MEPPADALSTLLNSSSSSSSQGAKNARLVFADTSISEPGVALSRLGGGLLSFALFLGRDLALRMVGGKGGWDSLL